MLEGTTITLYVSSGLYETDIQIASPSVYPHNICQLSLWLNGSCLKTSEQLNLSQVKNYTFKDITSENKSENYMVMIKSENGSWEDYQSISVDFRKEKNNVVVTSTKTFDVPSDTTTQENVSSDNLLTE